MRSFRALAAVLLMLSCMAVSLRAAADEGGPALNLTWQAPKDCPTRTEFERETARLLARSAYRGAIQVQIVMRREPRRIYRLELLLSAPVTGTRTILHPSCASATRAAALIVAMAIDADAVALVRDTDEIQDEVSGDAPASAYDGTLAASDSPAAEPQNSTQAPLVAAGPTTRPSSTPVPRAAPNRQPPPRVLDSVSTELPRSTNAGNSDVRLGLGGHLESTFTPSVALGARFGTALETSWFRVGLAAAWVPSSSVSVSLPESDVADIGRVGAHFSVWLLELETCVGRLQQSLNLALCGTLREHWIRASGRGVDERLDPLVTAPAATLGPLLALPLVGPLGVEAAAQAVFALRRPQFAIDPLSSAVFQPPRVGVGGTLSISLKL